MLALRRSGGGRIRHEEKEGYVEIRTRFSSVKSRNLIHRPCLLRTLGNVCSLDSSNRIVYQILPSSHHVDPLS